ncbi:MAG: hypothetical protein HN341_05185 [Verrucomicrobia bacterium]|jgi:hypothetical protein|nr:hypothetical protein [Verrucomicrobiota bacterium]
MADTYRHLKDKIVSHYAPLGVAVAVDPPGRGMPDLLGHKPDGAVFVGEIKSANEAAGSASSWWNHWSKPERDLRKHYSAPAPDQPSSLRGWCAVVDGQLREYCATQSVSEGDLVVEDGARHGDAIQQALQFLRSEGRVLSWSRTDEGDLHYWTIRYV